MNLPLLFALLPFVLFIALLFWRKTSLLTAAVWTLILTSSLAAFFWQTFPAAIYLSYTKGALIALDILIIVWGALFFLRVLRELNIIKNISAYLESFSKDYRVRVIILAWFLENFIEGTAGFGTPAVIVAPLLIGLGLKPLTAIIIALMGNSAAVVFGATGTPIRVGFAGLDTASVPQLAALINCVGFVVPVFMLWFLVSRHKNRLLQFHEALPFAIWSGVVFVFSSLLVVPLGQEFPSIIGAVVGLGLVFITTKLGIFVPAKIRRVPGAKIVRPTMPPLQTFLPYILLIVLLLIGKFALANAKIVIPFGLDYTFNFFNPGWAFILVGLFYSFFLRKKKNSTGRNLFASLKESITPFLVIVSMSASTQIMLNSGVNDSGLPSIINLIASIFETGWLPLWTPFVGAFGSFLTGSATVSNIMFGEFLATAAAALGLNVAKILALAVVGAAAGNMIALADVLAGETVVGLKNQERAIIKGVIVPCLTCVLLAGLIGLLLV